MRTDLTFLSVNQRLRIPLGSPSLGWRFRQQTLINTRFAGDGDGKRRAVPGILSRIVTQRSAASSKGWSQGRITWLEAGGAYRLLAAAHLVVKFNCYDLNGRRASSRAWQKLREALDAEANPMA
jgi:hypothetical protein